MQEFIQSIAREAGELVKGFYKATKPVQKDNWVDLVTEADIQANTLLVERIRAAYPEHGIISEEKDEDVNIDAEFIWTVDPLDGTNNFSHGIPFFTTMISLLKNKEPILSTVYDPIHNEMVVAEKGQGVTLNGRLITCSKNKKWEESMGISSPRWKSSSFHIYENIKAESQKYGLFWCCLLEGIGHQGIYVASGRLDWVIISQGPKLWDFAPVTLILQESGCKVTTHSGQPWTYSDREMIAAPPQLYDYVFGLVQKK